MRLPVFPPQLKRGAAVPKSWRCFSGKTWKSEKGRRRALKAVAGGPMAWNEKLCKIDCIWRWLWPENVNYSQNKGAQNLKTGGRHGRINYTFIFSVQHLLKQAEGVAYRQMKRECRWQRGRRPQPNDLWRMGRSGPSVHTGPEPPAGLEMDASNHSGDPWDVRRMTIQTEWISRK